MVKGEESGFPAGESDCGGLEGKTAGPPGLLTGPRVKWRSGSSTGEGMPRGGWGLVPAKRSHRAEGLTPKSKVGSTTSRPQESAQRARTREGFLSLPQFLVWWGWPEGWIGKEGNRAGGGVAGGICFAVHGCWGHGGRGGTRPRSGTDPCFKDSGQVPDEGPLGGEVGWVPGLVMEEGTRSQASSQKSGKIYDKDFGDG